MAKNRNEPAQEPTVAAVESTDPAVRQLAEQLFIRQWQPQQSITPEALASMCFDGAAKFCKVASTIQSER